MDFLKRLREAAAAFIVAGLVGASAANAETFVFPNGILGATGVSDTGNLLGDTPASATFARTSGIIVGYDRDITGNTTVIDVTAAGPDPSFIWFRFGRFDGGAFQNVGGAGLVNPGGGATANAYAQFTGPGPVTFSGVPFEAACLSVGGCNAVVFGGSTFSSPTSTGFSVASVVSSTPEPATWAFMMIAFAAVGAQAKGFSRRRRRAAETLLDGDFRASL